MSASSFLLVLMIIFISVPVQPASDAIIPINGNSAKRPRLESLSLPKLPMPPESLGMVLTLSKCSFKKVFDLIRGRPYEEGESMMPSNYDLFPVLRYHDAAQDDNFALRNWFDLEASPEKLEQLKILVSNPTVDFLIEDKLVLKQASQFGDLKVIKQMVERGVTPNSRAVVEASKYNHGELIKYYLDHPYWPKSDLVSLAATHGDLALVKALHDNSEFNKYFDQNLILPVFRGACTSGNLELVKFLAPLLPEDFSYNISKEIAMGGNLELVEYTKEKELLYINADEFYYWAAYNGTLEFFTSLLLALKRSPEEYMVSGAICGGNFKVFKELERLGLAEGEDLIKNIVVYFTSACVRGDLEFIKYLIEKYDIVPDNFLLEIAIRSGNIDVAKHFIECFNIRPSRLLDTIVKRRGFGWKADRRYFDFLDFLSSKYDYNYDLSDLIFSAKHHSSYYLQQDPLSYSRYLLSQLNIIPNQDVAVHASRAKDQNLMRILVQKYGFTPTVNALKSAVHWENIDGILWLARNGVVPDQAVWNHTIESPNFYITSKYFIEELKLAPSQTSLNVASLRGRFQLLKYFIQTGLVTPNNKTMEVAVLRQRIFRDNADVIDFLISVNVKLKSIMEDYEAELAQKGFGELRAMYRGYQK